MTTDTNISKFWRLLYKSPIGKIILMNKDMKEWDRLHNLYYGKTGFVIGNGPSLRMEDLDNIQDKITIASNKIYLAFSQTNFRPTIWTFIDQILVENIIEEVRCIKGNKYFSKSLKKIVKPMPGAIFWNEKSGYIKNSNYRKFSSDARSCLYPGHTITYINLQIAYHIGLFTVYLIGMDFSFTIPEHKVKHKYSEALVSKGEINHFHPDYRKKGEIWTVPDLERQRFAFLSAKKFYEDNGRKIYNASRKTKLDVYPKIDLDFVINKINT